MKTIFATLGALALAASLSSTAQAGSDGFAVQQENHAVTRGDYSFRTAESVDIRTAPVERTVLRTDAPLVNSDDSQQNFNLAPR